MPRNLDIVILGLSITSSWGNGHATTYRHLVSGLCRRGHRVLFLERDVPWYASNRDLPKPTCGETRLYQSIEELRGSYEDQIRNADLVIVGSYIPDGIELGAWVLEQAQGVRAFYDIDTPVTLRAIRDGACPYLSPALVPRYDLYLSFSGGPVLKHLEDVYGSPCARPLYCSVDPEHYFPEHRDWEIDLGYMGTYSSDRQPALEELLLEPARCWADGRFTVVGPQFPATIEWPENVRRAEHLAPNLHRGFYNRQRFTLNLTREEMRRVGYSPSIRLFEAAACGTAIISDSWPGLDELFDVGTEVLTAESSRDTLRFLKTMTEEECRQVGSRACRRVLAQHTGDHRAAALEQYFEMACSRPAARAMAASAAAV